MTLKRSNMGRLLTVLLMAAALCASAFGQRTSLTTTTLSVAIPAAPVTNQKVVTTISVASVTGMTSSTGSLPVAQGGIGGPASGVATFLYVDAELMQINSFNGTFVNVVRGVQGTPTMPHNSGATVYIATARQMVTSHGQVSGACTSATQPIAIPFIDPVTSRTYDCPQSGPFINTWVVGGATYSYQESSQNLNPNTIQTVSIPLTLSQLQTLHTIPIQVIPAKGAGTLIELTTCTLDLKRGSAAFTSGGTVTFGWGATDATTAAAATIASTVFTTFTASQAITVAGAMAVTADSLTLNLPIWVSAGSADFATGTGATGVLDCSYRVHSGF